jgi:hypothetical protein
MSHHKLSDYKLAVRKLGLYNLINLILVKERVRPAFLLQPQDKGNENIKEIIKSIKDYFPELTHSNNYSIYQGTIISYEDFNGREISLNEMGRILGYPCHEDYEEIDHINDNTYTADIIVNMESGNNISLISNKCLNETKKEKFQRMSNRIKDVLQKEEYTEILEDRVIDVIVDFEDNRSINVVIEKIINNKKLNEMDIDMITEILYNLGFEDNEEMESNIQYNNHIHRGIILGLLIYFKNDLLKPFYPLQSHTTEYPEVLKETEDWQEELTETIKNTKIKRNKSRTSKLRKTSKIK